MPSGIDAVIRRAIVGRRLLEVTYQRRIRRAEPHDYGIAGGKARLLVYQLSAAPARGGDRGWRLLDVDKIERCEILDEQFPGGRGDAHQQHHAWAEVFARVTPAGK